MTRLQPDTPDTLTRARAPQLAAPNEATVPVTLTCPTCGHTITLEVAGTAHCLPCRRIMRPAPGGGGKRRERAQHTTNPHEPHPNRGSNRPIMTADGGLVAWPTHQ